MALTTRALTDDGPDLGTFLLAAFCVFLSALASTVGTLLQKVAQGRRADQMQNRMTSGLSGFMRCSRRFPA